jgi:predicted small secreted protein
MKKIAYLMLVTMLSVTLAACASHKGMGGSKVKCPACGYEFTVPDNATGTDSN